MSGTVRRDLDKAYGALRAIDATTGERQWEFKFTSPSFAGVLSTASGVVFAGDNEGNFMAFDSRTGKNLWHYQTGSSLWGGVADDLHARRTAVRRHRVREFNRGIRTSVADSCSRQRPNFAPVSRGLQFRRKA